MQLQWESRQIPTLGVRAGETQTQEQTLEVRLGENLPDIGHIICGWGQPLLRGKQWRADSMSVSGGVMVWILYGPEDGTAPACVEAWLPFQLKWPLPPSQRDGAIRCDIRVSSVEARVLSARKMMVRAQISAMGEALEPETVEIFTPGEVPPAVQLLKNTYPVLLRAEAGEKLIEAEETLPLPGSTPAQVLCCQVEPVLEEQKLIGNRAVFRGDCAVHLLYASEDGSIHSAALHAPFAQFAELDRDYDKETTLDTLMAVSALEPELTGEGVHLSCTLVAQYVVLERRLLEVAQDAYSTENETALQRSQPELPVVLEQSRQQRELCLRGSWDGAEVTDVTFLPEQPLLHRGDGCMEAQLTGHAQLLYRDREGTYRSAELPLEQQWQIPAGEDTVLSLSIRTGQDIASTVAGDAVELTGSIEIFMTADTRQEIPMLSGMELGAPLERPEDRPSMILRRVGEETLWELAKCYGTTVEAIRQANALQDQTGEGKILLIPVS